MPDKLMVVAHPDDESLFGGAKLIVEQGWKVVCITNGNNISRRNEFEHVMKLANCCFEMWDYKDQRLELLNVDCLFDLKRVVNEKDWIKVVTHGKYGEYGHLHHKQVHNMMKEIVKNLLVFSFTKISLQEDVWNKKLNFINQYESQKRVCSRFMELAKKERI